MRYKGYNRKTNRVKYLGVFGIIVLAISTIMCLSGKKEIEENTQASNQASAEKVAKATTTTQSVGGNIRKTGTNKTISAYGGGNAGKVEIGSSIIVENACPYELDECRFLYYDYQAGSTTVYEKDENGEYLLDEDGNYIAHTESYDGSFRGEAPEVKLVGKNVQIPVRAGKNKISIYVRWYTTASSTDSMDIVIEYEGIPPENSNGTAINIKENNNIGTIPIDTPVRLYVSSGLSKVLSTNYNNELDWISGFSFEKYDDNGNYLIKFTVTKPVIKGELPFIANCENLVVNAIPKEKDVYIVSCDEDITEGCTVNHSNAAFYVMFGSEPNDFDSTKVSVTGKNQNGLVSNVTPTVSKSITNEFIYIVRFSHTKENIEYKVQVPAGISLSNGTTNASNTITYNVDMAGPEVTNVHIERIKDGNDVKAVVDFDVVENLGFKVGTLGLKPEDINAVIKNADEDSLYGEEDYTIPSSNIHLEDVNSNNDKIKKYRLTITKPSDKKGNLDFSINVPNNEDRMRDAVDNKLTKYEFSKDDSQDEFPFYDDLIPEISFYYTNQNEWSKYNETELKIVFNEPVDGFNDKDKDIVIEGPKDAKIKSLDKANSDNKEYYVTITNANDGLYKISVPANCCTIAGTNLPNQASNDFEYGIDREEPTLVLEDTDIKLKEVDGKKNLEITFKITDNVGFGYINADINYSPDNVAIDASCKIGEDEVSKDKISILQKYFANDTMGYKIIIEDIGGNNGKLNLDITPLTKNIDNEEIPLLKDSAGSTFDDYKYKGNYVVDYKKPEVTVTYVYYSKNYGDTYGDITVDFKIEDENGFDENTKDLSEDNIKAKIGKKEVGFTLEPQYSYSKSKTYEMKITKEDMEKAKAAGKFNFEIIPSEITEGVLVDKGGNTFNKYKYSENTDKSYYKEITIEGEGLEPEEATIEFYKDDENGEVLNEEDEKEIMTNENKVYVKLVNDNEEETAKLKITRKTNEGEDEIITDEEDIDYTLEEEGKYAVTDDSETIETYFVWIDRTAPELTLTKEDKKINVIAKDEGAGYTGIEKVRYVWTEGEQGKDEYDETVFTQELENSIAIPTDKTGKWTVSVAAFDRAGNYKIESLIVEIEADPEEPQEKNVEIKFYKMGEGNTEEELELNNETTIRTSKKITAKIVNSDTSIEPKLSVTRENDNKTPDIGYIDLTLFEWKEFPFENEGKYTIKAIGEKVTSDTYTVYMDKTAPQIIFEKVTNDDKEQIKIKVKDEGQEKENVSKEVSAVAQTKVKGFIYVWKKADQEISGNDYTEADAGLRGTHVVDKETEQVEKTIDIPNELTEGKWNLWVKTQDIVGNINEEKNEVTIERKEPDEPVEDETEPTAGELNLKTTDGKSYDGKTGKYTNKSVEISIKSRNFATDKIEKESYKILKKNSNGQYVEKTINGQTEFEGVTKLEEDGDYKIVLTSKSSVNNKTATNTYYVRIDTSKPKIQVTIGEDNKITLNTTDESGVDSSKTKLIWVGTNSNTTKSIEEIIKTYVKQKVGENYTEEDVINTILSNKTALEEAGMNIYEVNAGENVTLKPGRYSLLVYVQDKLANATLQYSQEKTIKDNSSGGGNTTGGNTTGGDTTDGEKTTGGGTTTGGGSTTGSGTTSGTTSSGSGTTTKSSQQQNLGTADKEISKAGNPVTFIAIIVLLGGIAGISLKKFKKYKKI